VVQEREDEYKNVMRLFRKGDEDLQTVKASEA
jgi:hypothetical protein